MGFFMDANRFNLPGWYGLGSGLEKMGSLELLQDMYQHWPFFQALLENAEMSLLKADMGIAKLYVNLVPERSLALRVYDEILSEYNRTVLLIKNITRHHELMDNEPIIQRTIHLRNPYIDPLNYLQVEMLRRLRDLPPSKIHESELLRDVIGLTINGIAGGLRNTG